MTASEIMIHLEMANRASKKDTKPRHILGSKNSAVGSSEIPASNLPVTKSETLAEQLSKMMPSQRGTLHLKQFQETPKASWFLKFQRLQWKFPPKTADVGVFLRNRSGQSVRLSSSAKIWPHTGSNRSSKGEGIRPEEPLLPAGPRV